MAYSSPFIKVNEPKFNPTSKDRILNEPRLNVEKLNSFRLTT